MSEDARVDEERATQRRARLVGLDYYNTYGDAEKTLYRDLLSNEELARYRVVPITADEHHIFFGVTNNTSKQAMASLKDGFTDQLIKFALISDTGFNEYMRLYNPPKQVVYQDIEVKTAGDEELIKEVSETLDKVRADDMLAYLVSQAHRLNSSDIHCENQPDYVRIRFRIDGVLHTIANLTKEKYRILVAAIASAGDVSTAAEGAQQGHIAEKVTMADGNLVDVNIRLETVPTVNGMDVVMRLFNMDASMYRLDKLVLSEQERAMVDQVISKPSGLAMMVGPTGSGKTTTLYSILNSLISDEHKIITIEDPVEFQFPGITQIPVRSSEHGNDDSFADKLRAVLRLDPDIVMIGEIRDMDTARTALQAALTGHLVLSTFHASGAAAALTRLADIIGQNPLFVSAIRLVMAQRLVRKLDDSTKQAYQPSDAEMQQIRQVVDSLPENIPKPDLNGLQLYKPGKSEDNPYGYTGQVPIREQFTMNGPLREMLEDKNRIISTETLEAAAIESGMRTMLQDGMLKVINGESTLAELYRVLG